MRLRCISKEPPELQMEPHSGAAEAAFLGEATSYLHAKSCAVCS